MKKRNHKNSMKIFLVIIFLNIVFACNNIYKEPSNKHKQEKDYTLQTVDTLNSLKAPVILIGKAKSLGNFSVALKDKTGKIVYFGNMSGLANSIGETRQIGDTIK